MQTQNDFIRREVLLPKVVSSINKEPFFKVSMTAVVAAVALAVYPAKNQPNEGKKVSASKARVEKAAIQQKDIHKDLKPKLNPKATIKKVCDDLGIEYNSVFESVYNELLNNSKRKLQATNSLNRNPNREQLLDIVNSIGQIIIDRLPIYTDEITKDSTLSKLDVLNIFTGMRDNRSDCDTRSLLVISILNDLKINHDLKVVLLPGHCVLGLNDTSGSLGTIIELNSNTNTVVFNHIGYYHAMFGPVLERGELTSFPSNPEVMALSQFSRDEKLPVYKRIKALDLILAEAQQSESNKNFAVNMKVKILLEDYKQVKNKKSLKAIEDIYNQKIAQNKTISDFIASSYGYALNEQEYYQQAVSVLSDFINKHPGEELDSYVQYIRALKALGTDEDQINKIHLQYFTSKNRLIDLKLEEFMTTVNESSEQALLLFMRELKFTKQSILNHEEARTARLQRLMEFAKSNTAKPTKPTIEDETKEFLAKTEKLLAEIQRSGDEQYKKDLSKWERSIKDLDGMDFNKKSIELNFKYAELLELDGQYAKTQELVSKLLERYPINYNALRHFLNICEKTGDNKSYLATIRKILNLYPRDAFVKSKLAEHHEKNNELDQALKLLREAANDNPINYLTGSIKFMERHPEKYSKDDINSEIDRIKSCFPGLCRF